MKRCAIRNTALLIASSMLVVATLTVLLVGLEPTLEAQAQGSYEVTLQQGLSGSCEDTYIHMFHPSDRFASSGLLYIGDKQRYAALVKFDLSAIPVDATIISARLHLYASGGGVPLPIAVHCISRTTEIAEVTWNKASAAENWGLAGCEDTATDRRANPEATVTVSAVPETVQWI